MRIKLGGAVFIAFISLSAGYLLGAYASSTRVNIEPTQEINRTYEKEVPLDAEAREAENTPVYYDVPLSHDLQDYIRSNCEIEEVPMGMILAMIKLESAFQSDIISKTNDYGLMQINKVNHKWLKEQYGVTDFLDPFQNVYVGIKMIGSYLRKYGDIHKALMAYNMGETGMEKAYTKGIYSTKYSEKIIEYMFELRKGE